MSGAPLAVFGLVGFVLRQPMVCGPHGNNLAGSGVVLGLEFTHFLALSNLRAELSGGRAERAVEAGNVAVNESRNCLHQVLKFVLASGPEVGFRLSVYVNRPCLLEGVEQVG